MLVQTLLGAEYVTKEEGKDIVRLIEVKKEFEVLSGSEIQTGLYIPFLQAV